MRDDPRGSGMPCCRPGLQALIGQEATTLAALILRLHDTDGAANAAAVAGLECMRDGFAPKVVGAALQAAIGS